MNSTLETIKRARALIALPERWTQKTMARNANGVPCLTRSHEAVCFCAHGALRAIADWPQADAAEGVLANEAGVVGLTGFNDTHTHAEVLAVFDRAVAKLEAACA